MRATAISPTPDEPAYFTPETARVSGRTLSYLASGRRAVVRHTGKSAAEVERWSLALDAAAPMVPY